MKRTIFVVCILGLINQLAISQKSTYEKDMEIAQQYYEENQFDQALLALQKIDTSVAFRDTTFFLKYYWILSDCYSWIKFETANKIYEKLLSFKMDSNYLSKSKIWLEILYNAGRHYINNSDVKKSTALLEEGIRISKNIYGSESTDWNRFLVEIGYIKSSILGDHDTGFQIIHSAIITWLQKNSENTNQVAYFYKRLSAVEVFRRNYSAALKYLQKSWDIYRNLNPESYKVFEADYWHKIGVIFYDMEKYDESIVSLNKSAKLFQEVFSSNHRGVGFCYQKIAGCYYQQKNYKKALEYFEKLLPIMEESYGKNSPRVYALYPSIIACLTHLNRFEDAYILCEKLKKKFDYNPTIPNPFDGLSVQRTQLIPILYFQAKNHFFWYRQNGNRRLLEEACHGFDRTVQLVEAIHADYEESGSKQYLLDLYYYVFEMALNAHYEWYRVSGDPVVFARALGYTERSRAILLTEALRRQDAGYAAGVPDSTRQQLAQLRKGIVEIQNQEYLLKKQGKEDSPEMRALHQRLYDLGEQRRRLEADIKKRFPAYATAGRRPEAPSVAQIQARLKPDEAWVTYFAGEDDMYAFVVQPQNIAFVHIPKNFPLEQWIEELRNAIYDYPVQRSDSLFHLYKTRAWGLYQKLLQPLPTLPNRLILALDGVLEYVPFEALFYAEAADCNGRNCPYLLRRHVISHARSAALWLKGDSPKSSAKRKILAYAPRFPMAAAQDGAIASRRSELGPLTYNETEVKQIGRYFPVQIARSAKATKEAFATSSSGYAVLHLATHAKANDEEGDLSFIAFTPSPKDTAQESYLFARELYAMSLPADLVVLSACETGIGEIKRGEGLVSLAYGFSHAGARSLITSLWRVSDRETADLMKRFYAGLRKKLPKDEALCQAKRAYLAEQTGWKAHPFFWAAFVAQGDMTPLDLPTPLPAWLWGLVGVVLALIAWAGWHKRRR